MSALIGFMSGAGDAMAKIGLQNQKQWSDDEREERSIRIRAEVEEAKEARLIALRSDAAVKAIGPTAAATAQAELTNAPTRAAAASVVANSAANDLLATAPTRGAAAKAALIGGELSDEVVAKKLAIIAQETATRGKAETDALIARGNDPAAVRATRNLAQAGHVESSGSTAQKALADLSIEEKQKVAELVGEYEKSKDPKRKAEIKESLIIRGVLKADEQATDKVTTEVMNKDGTTTKTERTVKRRPGEPTGTDKPSQEDVHAQARAAISGGAPASAVNKRLQELGYPPLEAVKGDKSDKKAEAPKTDEKPYKPAEGSKAAQAVADRETQRQRERTSADNALMSDAKRRMEQDEEDRKKAAAFRQKNKVD